AGRRLRGGRTGRGVRVAGEAGPGWVLDTVDDVVGWLAARTGPDVPNERRIDREHVGLCLDTCHLAVSFADRRAGTAATVRRITDAGLRVVKLQAPAALHVEDPLDPAARAAVGAFAEKRSIHQVRELTASGDPLPADDLPDALGGALPAAGPWRVHFHVPLHHEPA